MKKIVLIVGLLVIGPSIVFGGWRDFVESYNKTEILKDEFEYQILRHKNFKSTTDDEDAIEESRLEKKAARKEWNRSRKRTTEILKDITNNTLERKLKKFPAFIEPVLHLMILDNLENPVKGHKVILNNIKIPYKDFVDEGVYVVYLAIDYSKHDDLTGWINGTFYPEESCPALDKKVHINLKVTKKSFKYSKDALENRKLRLHILYENCDQPDSKIVIHNSVPGEGPKCLTIPNAICSLENTTKNLARFILAHDVYVAVAEAIAEFWSSARIAFTTIGESPAILFLIEDDMLDKIGDDYPLFYDLLFY